MNSKKVVKIPTLQIIPVIGFIIGLVFFMVGMGDFGFWNHDTNTPTEGFFPIIIATGLIIFSIMAFLQNIRKGGVEYRLLNWYVRRPSCRYHGYRNCSCCNRIRDSLVQIL